MGSTPKPHVMLFRKEVQKTKGNDLNLCKIFRKPYKLLPEFDGLENLPNLDNFQAYVTSQLPVHNIS